MEKKLNFKGLNVVAFEARHAKTMADFISLQGGNPVLAPALKEVPIARNPEAMIFGEKLFSNKIDALILLTGVGTRALVDILEKDHPREKIYEALRKVKIVPRGPKPIRVLKEWNVPYALTVPEPNTWRELLDTLDANLNVVQLHGKKVAVQEYGVSNPEFLDELAKRGADVLRVPVYRWELPDDLGPLKHAIAEILSGHIQLAFFTTAVQIDHVLKVAESMDKKEQLLRAFKHLVVASIGPDCSAALHAQGLTVDLESKGTKMADLVTETAERIGSLLKKQDQKLPEILSQMDLSECLFLKACRREPTRATPVWIMRQAGRYMKSYRDIREKTDFLTLCKTPELASRAAVEAQDTLGVDAAILFSDILLILEPMGIQLEFIKGGGPVIKNPVQSTSDVNRIKTVDVKKSLPFVMEAVRQTRAKLNAGVPLIGFAGAPFTLASYMIEGGSSKDFSKTKKFMKADWDRWNVLMKRLTDATADYLNAQIDSGVQAVQVFDSWAGVLEPDEYRMFVMPFSKTLFAKIKRSVPSIHFGTKTGLFLDLFAQCGATVVGVDQFIKLGQAWTRIGPERAIQGNMDPRFLVTGGVAMEMEVRAILDQAQGRPGHIFNLGHGVLPETPEENVKTLVKLVKRFSERRS